MDGKTNLVDYLSKRIKRILKGLAYSEIEEGVLKHFDSRDLINGVCYLPLNVHKIGNESFSGCKEKIKKVVASSNLLEIQEKTFSGFTNLIEVDLSKSKIMELKFSTFQYDTELTTVKVPKSLIKIGGRAFFKCKNLQNIEMSSKIVYIGDSAFYECDSLRNINLDNDCIAIEDSTFYNCYNLQGVVLPKGIRAIGINAFYGCKSIESLPFPSCIDEIKQQAFYDCGALKEVELPTNLEILGPSAFENCKNLQSVKMYDKLARVYERAFCNCGALENVKFSKNLFSIENSCFKDCKSLLSLHLYNGIMQIDNSAFENCKKLEKVVLPSSLSSIGDLAFSRCGKLPAIEFGKSLISIGNYAFEGCENLSELKLNSGLKYIGNSAFANSKLTELTLPNSLVEVSSFAFFNASRLKDIQIDNPQTAFGANVFVGCKENATIKLGSKFIEPEVINNYGKSLQLFLYAKEHNKHFPLNEEIAGSVPKDEKSCKEFFEGNNIKMLQRIIKEYSELWKMKKGKGKNGNQIQIMSLASLYKVARVMGVFETDGKTALMGYDFLKDNIYQLMPSRLIERFYDLQTQFNGYNKEFAKFVMKNYYNNQSGCFLQIYNNDTMGIEDYFSKAFNLWDRVKNVFPKKTVLANRARGSINNNLTQENVITALTKIKYKNVDKDNAELAELIGNYGYSQEDFNLCQNVWNIGKSVDKIINIPQDKNIDGCEDCVCYKILPKDDPNIFILGNITNNCQVIGGLGASCVKYGVTSPNSCFAEFIYKDDIVGESWIWFNEDTKVVCLDNIEIPTLVYDTLKSDKNFQKSFAKCLIRLSNGIVNGMKEKFDIGVRVTVGEGLNDFDWIRNLPDCRSPLPNDYKGYSDALRIQYDLTNAELKDFFQKEKTKDTMM